MKFCPACEKEKPLEAFHVDRRRSDGRKRDCAECCNEADREPARGRYAVRRKQRRDWAAEKLAHWRAFAIQAYGSKCVCCGESEPRFLTFDHVDGVPESHRRPSGKRKGGLELYVQLANEGYPPTVQLLCFNCNLGRELNGGVCPHETVRLRIVS